MKLTAAMVLLALLILSMTAAAQEDRYWEEDLDVPTVAPRASVQLLLPPG